MTNGEPAAARALPSWIEWIMYLKSIDCSHRPSIPGVIAGEALLLAHIGRRRIVTGDANLDVVVSVAAVQCEHVMADIALGDVDDPAPRDRGAPGDVSIGDDAGDGNGGGAWASGDDPWMTFDDHADVCNHGQAVPPRWRLAAGAAGSGSSTSSVSAPEASGPVSPGLASRLRIRRAGSRKWFGPVSRPSRRCASWSSHSCPTRCRWRDAPCRRRTRVRQYPDRSRQRVRQ